MPRFEYKILPINKVSITTKHINVKGKLKPEIVRYATIEDRTYITTNRFWSSLCSRYGNLGISTSLLRSGLFTYEEIFKRIANALTEGKLYNRITIDNKHSALLGMNSSSMPVCKYGELKQLLEAHNGGQITYFDDIKGKCGIVSSMHQPRINYEFKIGADKFTSKFNYQIPIDGFGKPLIYLTAVLERNNRSPIPIIGCSPSYKCELNLGKDENVMFSLTRALEGYNNEDGFMAMRSKLEIASKSWASIMEAQNLYKVILHSDLKANGMASLFVRTDDDVDSDGQPLSDNILIQKAFLKLTGNIPAMYGIVHIDALSKKKMSRLPVKCTVYDLIVFASEILDGFTDGDYSLSNYIGNLLGSDEEFDLENSKETMPNFSDFLNMHDDAKLAI